MIWRFTDLLEIKRPHNFCATERVLTISNIMSSTLSAFPCQL